MGYVLLATVVMGGLNLLVFMLSRFPVKVTLRREYRDETPDPSHAFMEAHEERERKTKAVREVSGRVL